MEDSEDEECSKRCLVIEKNQLRSGTVEGRKSSMLSHDQRATRFGCLQSERTLFSEEQLQIYEMVELYLIELKEYATRVADCRGDKLEQQKVQYPKPFHIFLQGSAGSEKSFLIGNLVELVPS